MQWAQGFSGVDEEGLAVSGEGVFAVVPADLDDRLPLLDKSSQGVSRLVLQTAELGEEASGAGQWDSDAALSDVAAPDLPLVEVERAGVGTERPHRVEVDGNRVLADLSGPLVVERDEVGGRRMHPA